MNVVYRRDKPYPGCVYLPPSAKFMSISYISALTFRNSQYWRQYISERSVCRIQEGWLYPPGLWLSWPANNMAPVINEHYWVCPVSGERIIAEKINWTELELNYLFR